MNRFFTNAVGKTFFSKDKKRLKIVHNTKTEIGAFLVSFYFLFVALTPILETPYPVFLAYLSLGFGFSLLVRCQFKCLDESLCRKRSNPLFSYATLVVQTNTVLVLFIDFLGEFYAEMVFLIPSFFLLNHLVGTKNGFIVPWVAAEQSDLPDHEKPSRNNRNHYPP